MSARAGHYVHILPRPKQSFDPLLRRAFSILKATAASIEILYRVEGRGTALMAKLQAGEAVDILGPLGQPFTSLPTSAILVGGGVGVPPLAMLASQRQNEQVVALIGARSQHEVICVDDFKSYGVPVEISTDDGTKGYHGRVTDLLHMHLQEIGQRESLPIVFACGPFAMLRAVATLADRYGVRCQISLEENMPCGVGVCNGCVVPVHGAGDEYGSYRRICVDGPVVWADEVDWGRYPGSAC
ncbi:MAG: dihydroorotate dehydrogenase electron transfer subunit [Burkholderiaceae bacterium]